MQMVRLSKILLVAAIAFTASLVTFGNITDYDTNWSFVVHVLSMDTIFPNSTIHYRAITSPTLQKLAYCLIIAAELATAILCWIGAAAMLRSALAPAPHFARAKTWAITGLTVGFLTWQVGFMAVGGEWFGMWQSTTWNGEESAFRFQMTILAVLIYLVLPAQDDNSLLT
jgi:predicted small integral membrane protein